MLLWPMLLLQILFAAPIVWLATQLAGIEDDIRDIFNVAVISAFGPPLIQFALMISIVALLSDSDLHAARSVKIIVAVLYYPFQAVLTALACKRLLVADWRQSWLVGGCAAAASVAIALIAHAYTAAVSISS